MSCDYIKGTAGHYMPFESFSNFRKCERMIAKIKFSIPIHLLDHLIIPINVRESHCSVIRGCSVVNLAGCTTKEGTGALVLA